MSVPVVEVFTPSASSADQSQAHWSPYVPHVDEWLEEAAEPDEETDSWVARTKRVPDPVELLKDKRIRVQQFSPGLSARSLRNSEKTTNSPLRTC